MSEHARSGEAPVGPHAATPTPGRTLGSQLRRRARDFVAILTLIVVAAVVGGYILSQERLTFPSWVPVIGSSFYTLNGEFQTAQAVTPGQGQAVTIAGVKVGEIASVRLSNGLALVTMHIDPADAPVYRDATMLLRPKSQLKDMTVELSKGTPAAGRLSSGGVIPVAQTSPDINFDEILSALDGDSRAYLQELIGSGGQALAGQGNVLSSALRRLDPTARDLQQINGLLVARRNNIARVIHNVSILTAAVGTRDTQLASLVNASDAVLGTFRHQDVALQQALGQLPGVLGQTRSSLGKLTGAADQLGRALGGLQPAARALGPGLKASASFFKATSGTLESQIGPFAKAAQPLAASLTPAARTLAAASPDLTTGFSVLGEFLNELAYEPGATQPGFLFYLDWANHNLDSVLSTADADGPMRQGLLLFNCPSLQLLGGAANVNANVKLLLGLLNPPPTSQVCAGQGSTGVVTLPGGASTASVRSAGASGSTLTGVPRSALAGKRG